MKNAFSLLAMILIIGLPSDVGAEHLYAVQSNKSGKFFQNELYKYDSSSGRIINKTNLINSYKRKISKLPINSNEHLVFYTKTDFNKAVIQIVTKENTNEIKTVKIDPLNTHFSDGVLTDSFVALNGENELILYILADPKTNTWLSLTLIKVRSAIKEPFLKNFSI